MAALGAEAGSQEQQSKIKKNIQIERDLEKALQRLNARGIQSGVSWIIGYPNETVESMNDTITVAARIKHLFPNSPSDIFPFRAIPGTEDYDTAVRLGYKPPHSLDECLPGLPLLGQDAPPFGRHLIEPASAFVGLLHPGPLDPAALLEPIEQGVEGVDVKLQLAARPCLDQFAQVVPVPGL